MNRKSKISWSNASSPFIIVWSPFSRPFERLSKYQTFFSFFFLPSNLIHLRQWLLDWNIKCATQSANELSSTFLFNVLKCCFIVQTHCELLYDAVVAGLVYVRWWIALLSIVSHFRNYLDEYIWIGFFLFLDLFFFQHFINFFLLLLN